MTMRTRRPHVTYHCKTCNAPIALPKGDIRTGRMKYCSEDCRKRVRNPHWPNHLCVSCKEILPRTAFGFRADGDQVVRRRSCTKCLERARPRKYQIRPVERPCAHCARTFFIEGSPVHTRLRKFCSRACSALGRQNPEKKCQRCHQRLARDAFSRSGRDGKVRQYDTCNDCHKDWHKPDPIHARARLTFSQMMTKFRQEAWRNGHSSKVPIEYARKLYRAGCQLCDGSVSRLTRIDEKSGFGQKNVRPLCRMCHQLLLLMPLDVLELHLGRILHKAQKERADGDPQQLQHQRANLRTAR